MNKHDDDNKDTALLAAKLLSKETLHDTWKKGQDLLEAFWKLWRDDYLLSPQKRSQINLSSPQVEVNNTVQRRYSPNKSESIKRIMEN